MSKVMAPLRGVQRQGAAVDGDGGRCPAGWLFELAVLLPTATTRPAWMSRVEPVKLLGVAVPVLSRNS